MLLSNDLKILLNANITGASSLLSSVLFKSTASIEYNKDGVQQVFNKETITDSFALETLLKIQLKHRKNLHLEGLRSIDNFLPLLNTIPRYYLRLLVHGTGLSSI